mmetsp:Transcript_2026/g.4761  ORF Transcript_2026/g.4761 Transcript_2026/m.4761 type:complete len:209 (-) Transcript_2026:498-1124(-)
MSKKLISYSSSSSIFLGDFPKGLSSSSTEVPDATLNSSLWGSLLAASSHRSVLMVPVLGGKVLASRASSRCFSARMSSISFRVMRTVEGRSRLKWAGVTKDGPRFRGGFGRDFVRLSAFFVFSLRALRVLLSLMLLMLLPRLFLSPVGDAIVEARMFSTFLLLVELVLLVVAVLVVLLILVLMGDLPFEAAEFLLFVLLRLLPVVSLL